MICARRLLARILANLVALLVRLMVRRRTLASSALLISCRLRVVLLGRWLDRLRVGTGWLRRLSLMGLLPLCLIRLLCRRLSIGIG